MDENRKGRSIASQSSVPQKTESQSSVRRSEGDVRQPVSSVSGWFKFLESLDGELTYSQNLKTRYKDFSSMYPYGLDRTQVGYYY